MKVTMSHADSVRLDEITRDKSAARAVFEAASLVFQNQMSSILKSETEMWLHLRETYRLSPEEEYAAAYDVLERRYVIKPIGGEASE